MKEKHPRIRERRDTEPRAPRITVRRPRPRQTPTSLRRQSQKRHPGGEPASEKVNEPSQVTMSKDYANRGEAAMGSRASDATNNTEAEVFAANPSHRRPSSEGTPTQAATALSPRLESLLPLSCGSHHAMSHLRFPPLEGSHMGPRLLPL
ncbi:LOW QUALITY PROTEIN: uncharacterized protein CSNK1G2-AS1-like [Saimiri boliviensis]|uniref:LOW QUALITY PROTEIN: uncharacterized protein CSNK1G2-AS1-like n=1 Tax=Saimiri boliviensis TaxID=27679 RepID=UPI003D7809C3